MTYPPSIFTVHVADIPSWALPAALAVALLFSLVVLMYGHFRRRTLLERLHALESVCARAQDETERAVAELAETSAELAQEQRTTTALRVECARMDSRHEAEQAAFEEKLQLLQSAREQMKLEFSQLASTLLEQGQDRLTQTATGQLANTLTPLRTQLQDFRQRIEDVNTRQTQDQAALRAQLQGLEKLNAQMSEEAHNLTRALKGDKKLQGNWGEMILERVLEQSGLRAGIEYQTQVALSDSSGDRRLPDVVVRLPEERDLIIDAKVSLVAYEQFATAEEGSAQEEALKAHTGALRQHIAGLAQRDYSALPGLRSLDFVLMFVPIEPAFTAALRADTQLLSYASERKVILTSPSTLLATLRTVETLWRHDQQNRNAEKIARQAGGIYDQFVLILESMDDLGKALDRSRESYDRLARRLSQGKGNLLRRVAGLKTMGAPVHREHAALQHLEGEGEAVIHNDNEEETESQ